MLGCGDTFITGDAETDDWHLWIVVSAPSEGEVVTVSVSTKRKNSEPLMLLQNGDHPFIRHDSVIDYKFSRIRIVDDIETAIRNGVAKTRERISEVILKRVQSGLLDSDFTPNGVRHYYKSLRS